MGAIWGKRQFTFKSELTHNCEVWTGALSSAGGFRRITSRKWCIISSWFSLSSVRLFSKGSWCAYFETIERSFAFDRIFLMSYIPLCFTTCHECFLSLDLIQQLNWSKLNQLWNKLFCHTFHPQNMRRNCWYDANIIREISLIVILQFSRIIFFFLSCVVDEIGRHPGWLWSFLSLVNYCCLKATADICNQTIFSIVYLRQKHGYQQNNWKFDLCSPWN